MYRYIKMSSDKMPLPMDYAHSITNYKIIKNGQVNEIIEESVTNNGKVYTQKTINTPFRKKTYKSVRFAPNPVDLLEDDSLDSKKIERMPTPFPFLSKTMKKRRKRLRKKRKSSSKKKK